MSASQQFHDSPEQASNVGPSMPPRSASKMPKAKARRVAENAPPDLEAPVSEMPEAQQQQPAESFPSPEPFPLPEAEPGRFAQHPRDVYFEPPSDQPPEEHLPEADYVVVLQAWQPPQASPAGFALAAVINYLRRERGNERLVSPEMLTQTAIGFNEQDKVFPASALREVMIGWWQHGVCDADQWQANGSSPLSPEILKLAEEHKPTAFARVRADVQSLKAAVHHVHAVLVSAQVSDIWDRVPDGVIEDSPSAARRGSHAFAVIGYTRDGFIVQNCLGPEWSNLRVDGLELAGAALWRYEDAERWLEDAWVARIPGHIVSRRSYRPGYRTDSVEGEIKESDDRLGILAEVRALSAVAAAQDVEPPLSIGLFGDWGSGKSFFMRQMQRHIRHLDHSSRNDPASAYCSNIVQIRFNAWHYLDTNLWASLVSQIFDGLLEHIRKEETEEEKKTRLEAELQKQSEVLKAAQSTLAAAQRQEEVAKEVLNDRRQELNQARTALAMAKDDLPRLLDEDPLLRGKLEAVARQIGVDRLPEKISELGKHAQEITTTWGKIRAAVQMLLRPEGRTHRLTVLCGGAAVIAVFWWMISDAVMRERLQATTQFIVKSLGLLIAGLGWLATQIRKLQPAARALSEVTERVDQLRAARLDELTKAERDTVDVRSRAVRNAEQNLAETESRIAAIRMDLERLQPAEQLRQFIMTRGGSSDYTRQLGIVSMVRNDFERLSVLLRRNRTRKAEAQPGQNNGNQVEIPVQRIVLYIDDLDRCTPERVVAVLEAVHLLLSFPLFVVVVAVDPRWLRRSLEKHYPDLLELPERTRDDSAATPPATPQDYLEKIFQIPLYLQPITTNGYRGLISKLAGRDVDRGANGLPGETPQLDLGRQPADMPFPDGVGEGDLMVDEEPLNPDQLRFREWELKEMQRLAAVFRTPRAVNRFVNTYRLVRAMVASRDLARFEGTREAPGQFRWPMLLLAILAGYPNTGLRFVQKLSQAATTTPNESMEDFLSDTFATKDAVNDGDGTTDVPPLSGSNENTQEIHQDGNNGVHDPFASEWRRLGGALSDLDGPPTIGEFAPWLESVARFSFVPDSLERGSASLTGTL